METSVNKLNKLTKNYILLLAPQTSAHIGGDKRDFHPIQPNPLRSISAPIHEREMEKHLTKTKTKTKTEKYPTCAKSTRFEDIKYDAGLLRQSQKIRKSVASVHQQHQQSERQNSQRCYLHR